MELLCRLFKSTQPGPDLWDRIDGLTGYVDPRMTRRD